jgi:hypothetical protein
MLLRRFRLTISIGIWQPKPFSTLFMALISTVLESLLSITNLRDNPFISKAHAKNFVAEALLRRLDSMKRSA